MNEKEINIEDSKLKDEILQNATLKECFLKDKHGECCNKIINAHSLQRMGSLSVLESIINGNYKVYSLTEKQINPVSGQIELKPIGKKAASTFFGFCGNHDSKIFQPIEQNPNSIDLNSDEHCFLLSFRAFAISFHRKKEDILLFSKKDKELRGKIKKYFNNNKIEEMLEGSIMGLQDMKPYKLALIDALNSEDYSYLDYFTYELDYTAPIAMSMLTTPPYLFSGKDINTSIDPNYKYSDILTTVIPLKNKTLILLAAFKGTPYGATYLDELYNMGEVSLQKALTWHILTTAENCYFSPQWFDNLNGNQKQFIIDLTEFCRDLNTPYLKYNSINFNLNLFDKKYSITK